MTNTSFIMRSRSGAENPLRKAQQVRVRVVDGMITIVALLDVFLGLIFLLSK